MSITVEEIRGLRHRLGLTQQQLADRLNLSREAVAQWETGRSKPSGPAEMILRQMQVAADGEATRRRKNPIPAQNPA